MEGEESPSHLNLSWNAQVEYEEGRGKTGNTGSVFLLTTLLFFVSCVWILFGYFVVVLLSGFPSGVHQRDVFTCFDGLGHTHAHAHIYIREPPRKRHHHLQLRVFFSLVLSVCCRRCCMH